MRKLSDADVSRLRERAAAGVPLVELASEFGVTRQYAGRLVRRSSRQKISGLDADFLHGGGVLAAVERFLAGCDLDAAADVLAETARALAGSLDRCGASGYAAAAAAAPSLAHQLLEVMGELKEGRVEPDGIDELRMRRDTRRLAAAVEYVQPAESVTRGPRMRQRDMHVPGTP